MTTDKPADPTEPKLDSYHWHEALDRTHMLSEIWQAQIIDTHVISQHPELAALAERIAELIGELYQAVGRLDPTIAHPARDGAPNELPPCSLCGPNGLTPNAETIAAMQEPAVGSFATVEELMQDLSEDDAPDLSAPKWVAKFDAVPVKQKMDDDSRE